MGEPAEPTMEMDPSKAPERLERRRPGGTLPARRWRYLGNAPVEGTR